MDQQRKDSRSVFILETIHIPLWLFKDLCWLLSYRTMGVVMAVPTLLVAIIMVFITRKDSSRFLPNVSILFWIIANANWMVDEFYELGIRQYSLYPFLAGVLVFVIFISLKLMEWRNNR